METNPKFLNLEGHGRVLMNIVARSVDLTLRNITNERGLTEEESNGLRSRLWQLIRSQAVLNSTEY